MTTRQLAYKAPVSAAIQPWATSPDPGEVGASAWSTISKSLLTWTGTVWEPVDRAPYGGVFLPGEDPSNYSNGGADGPVTLALQFFPLVEGWCYGLRFWKNSALNNGVHTGGLWNVAGELLASGTFTGETNSGWQYLFFDSPVFLSAGNTYSVGYHTTVGYFALAGGVYDAPRSYGVIALDSGAGGFSYASSLHAPTGSFNSTSYGVDVLFRAHNGGPGATAAPIYTVAYDSYEAANAVPLVAKPNGSIIRMTLAGDLTLNITKGTDGQKFQFELKQDSTGGRAVTLGPSFAFGSDVASFTPSSSANETDILFCQFDGASGKARVLSISRGY